MTTIDRTGASDAEFQARIAAFDAAPVPPEVVVETVARAIAASDGVNWDNYLTGMLGLPCDYRKNAAAAIAALPPSPAGEAVKRVNLALATTSELEAECAKRGLDVRDPFALASPAPAPHGEEPTGCGCGVPGCVWGHGA